MDALTYSYARQHLDDVIRRVNDNHESVMVTSQWRKPVVIVSLEEYESLGSGGGTVMNLCEVEDEY